MRYSVLPMIFSLFLFVGTCVPSFADEIEDGAVQAIESANLVDSFTDSDRDDLIRNGRKLAHAYLELYSLQKDNKNPSLDRDDLFFFAELAALGHLINAEQKELTKQIKIEKLVSAVAFLTSAAVSAGIWNGLPLSQMSLQQIAVVAAPLIGTLIFSESFIRYIGRTQATKDLAHRFSFFWAGFFDYLSDSDGLSDSMRKIVENKIVDDRLYKEIDHLYEAIKGLPLNPELSKRFNSNRAVKQFVQKHYQVAHMRLCLLSLLR